MLVPWNGSHRKTGSGCRVLEAATFNFVVKITHLGSGVLILYSQKTVASVLNSVMKEKSFVSS